jgi:hypothetical protein
MGAIRRFCAPHLDLEGSRLLINTIRRFFAPHVALEALNMVKEGI